MLQASFETLGCFHSYGGITVHFAGGLDFTDDCKRGWSHRDCLDVTGALS